MLENAFVIYGIRRIEDDVVRYVGYTINLKKRMSRHLSTAGKLGTPISDWIASVGIDGVSFSVIEYCPAGNKEFVLNREKYWISHYRNLQGSINDKDLPHRLLNVTDGGGGFLGGVHTPEAKLRISSYNRGKKWSEESRDKLKTTLMSQGGSWRGKEFSEEHRRKLSESRKGTLNHFYGRRHSSTTKSKISVANSGENSPWFGRNHTAETKEKISKSNREFSGGRLSGERVGTSKLTETSVREIRQKFESGEYTKASLSREYSISYTQVSRIISGEAWKNLQ